MNTHENEMDKLFASMDKFGASDLHLKVGSPPVLRIAKSLRTLDMPPLTGEQIRTLVFSILTPEQQEVFTQEHDLDLAYSLTGVGRFRVNIFMQRGSISLAARKVSMNIPTFEELGLPARPFKWITNQQQGLVIMAGPTGSGKSTTLASIIESINNSRKNHIVTIEDPIEYLYRDKKSIINQREVGIDVDSFKHALKFIVRQDPDVILVGEMRDAETFSTCLTAAETGHLVFGTLHSSSASQTIGRILDMFSADEQNQIRQGMHANLRAIVCQKLLPSIRPERDLVPAVEILLVNPSARKAIKDGEDNRIDDIIKGGKEDGMQDFNKSLLNLIQDGLINEEVGLTFSPNPEALRMNLKGIFLDEERKIIT